MTGLEIAAIVSGVVGAAATATSVGITADTAAKTNDMRTGQQNWDFANYRSYREAMQYYLNNGTIDGYKPSGKYGEFSDVADIMTPYLTLTGIDMQKKSQELQEEQFKYNQYVNENSMAIRMKDLQNAGLSPLLATGQGATPTSTNFATGSTLMQSPSRQSSKFDSFFPIGDAGAGMMSLADTLTNIELKSAQTKNLQADATLKDNQAINEKAKTPLINEQVKMTSEQIKKMQAETKSIYENIKNQPYIRDLTESQAYYYAEKINELRWNNTLSNEWDIRTTDQLPIMINEIENLVKSLGIDTNTDFGRGLIALAFGIIAFGGSSGFKISKSTKGKGGVVKHYEIGNK